jgi:hypothetical protein
MEVFVVEDHLEQPVRAQGQVLPPLMCNAIPIFDALKVAVARARQACAVLLMNQRCVYIFRVLSFILIENRIALVIAAFRDQPTENP